MTIVEAPGWAEGMAASIRAGIAALPERTDAVLMLLADMPEIGARDLDRLIAGFDPAEGREIVRAATADGVPGHPVLFGRRFFESLAALEGDRGARDLLREGSDYVVEVRLDGQAAVTDLDTPEDWDAWRAAGARPSLSDSCVVASSMLKRLLAGAAPASRPVMATRVVCPPSVHHLPALQPDRVRPEDHHQPALIGARGSTTVIRVVPSASTGRTLDETRLAQAEAIAQQQRQRRARQRIARRVAIRLRVEDCDPLAVGDHHRALRRIVFEADPSGFRQIEATGLDRAVRVRLAEVPCAARSRVR